MQLSMNFKTVVALGIIAAGGYYAYDLFFGGSEGGDVRKLMRIRRDYKSARDYQAVFSAMDSKKPAVQKLAVEILTENVERPATPKMLEMLKDPNRAEQVKDALATAMGRLGINDKATLERLVQLTDKAEPEAVRRAAHDALLKLTGAGAVVKLGDSTREQWTRWLQSQSSGGTR